PTLFRSHVADAPAGSLLDFPAIGLDPVEIAYACFARGRLDGNFPGPLPRRLAVDFERDQFPRKILEIRIDVAVGARFLAVHGNQVVSRFDLQDRKSTRLNSSHVAISYAVFCLKKKKKKIKHT